MTGDWQEEEVDSDQVDTGEWLTAGGAGSGAWMRRLRRRTNWVPLPRPLFIHGCMSTCIHPAGTSCLS